MIYWCCVCCHVLCVVLYCPFCFTVTVCPTCPIPVSVHVLCQFAVCILVIAVLYILLLAQFLPIIHSCCNCTCCVALHPYWVPHWYICLLFTPIIFKPFSYVVFWYTIFILSLCLILQILVCWYVGHLHIFGIFCDDSACLGEVFFVRSATLVCITMLHDCIVSSRYAVLSLHGYCRPYTCKSRFFKSITVPSFYLLLWFSSSLPYFTGSLFFVALIFLWVS